MRRLTCVLPAATLALVLSAGPITYTTPNLDPTPVGATKSVSFAGATYLNKGLVGVGNFPASAVDGLGDTLGSFSSFKVDPALQPETFTVLGPAMPYTLGGGAQATFSVRCQPSAQGLQVASLLIASDPTNVTSAGFTTSGEGSRFNNAL